MRNRNKNQAGFSLIELLIVVSIILVIAAIAIPSLLQARVTANEASAVASLRTVNTAMISYASSYPTVGFAPTLAALGGTNCAPPDETGACLIDSVLASGTKSGYTFNSTGIGSAPAGEYFAVGSPMSGSGNRSFCSTEDGAIHYDPTGAAIADHDSCLALTPLQ
ncbi:MAG TPA: type II secretion system protein [Terriglobales bacterium]|nr:type II secretion system protein [Terriglobales bacterium]